MKNDYFICYSVYSYAPETFHCTVNGIDFEVDDPTRLGCMVLSGGKERKLKTK